MGEGRCARCGRTSRILRFLLLLVLTLAAIEYLFGSILDASQLKAYLYSPLYNTTLYTHRNANILTEALNQDPNEKVSINNTDNNFTITRIGSTDTVLYDSIEVKHNSTGSSIGQNNADITTPLLITKIEGIVDNLVASDTNVNTSDAILPLCDSMPPELGPVPVNDTDIELDWVDKKFPEVKQGGRYTPPNCTARHKVAIIVPFRDRQQHLAIFLNHMHPFLMKQQIEYGIFIVEQEGKSNFNRAKLMNVGFVESQRLESDVWQCFIFHDIDLLPLDTRNLYSCPEQPRHMSAAIDVFKFKLPYVDIFGGVSAVTLEQFTNVNGFSNKYWGWGGEDDDISARLRYMNYNITRYNMSIARYTMLKHEKAVPNPTRTQLLKHTRERYKNDGLSTLKYKLAQVTRNHLYTHILANIDERS